MNKVVLLPVVLIMLLSLAQVGHAVDLQAGSYIKLGGVGVFGVIPQSPYYAGTDWNFTGDLGMVGPFVVSRNPFPGTTGLSVP